MSAPKGYNVSDLSEYIEVNKDVLVRDMVLGNGDLKGETISQFTHQLGVKTSERLNYLDVNPVLQASNGCGFNPNSNNVFSERVIDTALAKYEDEFCYDDLLGKFNEYLVRVSAEEGAMPYEATIMEQVIKGIRKEVEKQVWQGSANDGDLIDGITTLANGVDSSSTIFSTSESGSTAYQRIIDTYFSIPEEWVDEAVIYVNASIFRSYAQDLVAKNYFHYEGENGELTELFIPASDVKVRKVAGLVGNDTIVATVPANIVYGCDLMDSKETVDAWYDKTDEVMRLRCKFNFGVSTLYPDAVVINTVDAGH